MGRLTKAKIDEIAKLRQQGYTQKETAEKVKVHLRTVRKYDPLKEQRPVKPTPEQVRETEEACVELAAKGLAYESNGRFRISPLGRRVCERFKELRQREILQILAEADSPVPESAIEEHLTRVLDQLFNQAVDEVKSRQD